MPFSAARVNRVIASLSAGATTQREIRSRWLAAVARRVVTSRPDLATELLAYLGEVPNEVDQLVGLSIGEVSVCYEALLSRLDRASRKSAGQFFTPDDAARFMAERAGDLGEGVWLDPCCGVGNLSWHLAAMQPDPTDFVRNRLTLIDRDSTALSTAVALIAAEYSGVGDPDTLSRLALRATARDFLSRSPLPSHDFVIVNPPYARADAVEALETGKTRDLFAYFVERIAKTSRGFVAVTPASYLSAPKFGPLRAVLERETTGGDVYVFDNVPDTLFRGYKFGSNNTSKTNFVRAAVTVSGPSHREWRTTPILRWQVSDRSQMFAQCIELLSPRRLGPDGEWAKLGPHLEAAWDDLARESETIADLLAETTTPFSLDVGLTPRYYISATYRNLDRGSKATLYFANAEDRDRAAMVLNSSIPYLWWRALDGGVTLPRRVLMSVPVPASTRVDPDLLTQVRASEVSNLVTKLNAGRDNENVKHPIALVEALNEALLPSIRDLKPLYASSMFPLDR